MNRLGKLKGHPVLGDCVRVDLRSWEGPTEPGATGRERWSGPVLFPRDQSGRASHPRHPSGYDEDGEERVACVSPSVSYYRDLCAYGQFRWANA